jgi:hypothetical protein
VQGGLRGLYGYRSAGWPLRLRTDHRGLVGEGTHVAIVGNRGIGKTSLARQIVNIASGDNDLLDRLGLIHDRKLDFLAVYFTCGNSIKNSQDLLERLLTSKSCLGDWVYDIPTAAKAMKGLKAKAGANLFGLELGASRESSSEQTFESAMPEHQVDAIFTNVVTAISAQMWRHTVF